MTIIAEVIFALENNKLELPTLPDIALQLQQKMDDPSISVDQLIHLLHTDPVITANIIKIANTAAF